MCSSPHLLCVAVLLSLSSLVTASAFPQTPCASLWLVPYFNGGSSVSVAAHRVVVNGSSTSPIQAYQLDYHLEDFFQVMPLLSYDRQNCMMFPGGGDVFEFSFTNQDWLIPARLNKNLSSLPFLTTPIGVDLQQRIWAFSSYSPSSVGWLKLFYIEMEPSPAWVNASTIWFPPSSNADDFWSLTSVMSVDQRSVLFLNTGASNTSPVAESLLISFDLETYQWSNSVRLVGPEGFLIGYGHFFAISAGSVLVQLVNSTSNLQSFAEYSIRTGALLGQTLPTAYGAQMPGAGAFSMQVDGSSHVILPLTTIVGTSAELSFADTSAITGGSSLPLLASWRFSVPANMFQPNYVQLTC